MTRTLPRLPLDRSGPIACLLVVLASACLRVVYRPSMLDVDADVYAMAGRAIRDGRPIYEGSVHGLPFTYPPFAAVLFAPLSDLPPADMHAGVAFSSVLLFALCAVLVGRRLGFRPWAVTALFVAGMVTEPMVGTIVLGQVNCLVMALVVLDVLVLPRRWRGVLIGVAAGIKIIPGVFAIYYLFRREWAAAARAGLAMVCTVVVGALFAPRESWTFWSGGFTGLERFQMAAVIGSDNQSLVAVYLRLTRDLSPSPVITYGLCALAVGVGTLVAVRLQRRGDTLGALVALAFGALLGSPVSWTHHWIWVMPALAVFASRGWWWSALGLELVFVVAPMWRLDQAPYAPLHFGATALAVSSVYTVAAGLVLARLWWGARSQAPGQEDGVGRHSPELQRAAG